MIVSDLKKLKEDLYEVVVEEKSYIVTEESVLKYRLFKGYELSASILEECLATDEFIKLKKKAYLYSLKYLKNSYETIGYLLDREVSYSNAKKAVEELKQEGFLEDQKLAIGMAASLARASNGAYMIRFKLKNRHFEDKDIEMALASLTEEDIQEGKEKLLKKGNARYKSLSSFERNQKLKELFYRHGYEIV